MEQIRVHSMGGLYSGDVYTGPCNHCGDTRQAHKVHTKYDGNVDQEFTVVACEVINCHCRLGLKQDLRNSDPKNFVVVSLDKEGNSSPLYKFGNAPKDPIPDDIDIKSLNYYSMVAVIQNHQKRIKDIKTQLDALNASTEGLRDRFLDMKSVIRALRQGSCNPEAPCDRIEDGAEGSYICDYHA